MHRLFAIIAALFAVFMTGMIWFLLSGERYGGGATDSERLIEFAERYTDAWCSQDPLRVAGFYAPDGELRVNDADAAVGREAIAAVAAGFIDPELAVRRIEAGDA